MKNTKNILENIEDELNGIYSKYNNCKIIICGDFSSRIAEKGEIETSQLPDQSSIFSRKRISHDQIINEKGQKFSNRNELFITNGRFPSDSPAEFTYISTQGKSLIDIMLCNAEALFNVIDFKVHSGDLSIRSFSSRY